MEVNSKPWYESLTIWGTIVGVLGTILGFFNVVFPADAQSQAATAITNIAVAWSAKDYGAVLTGVMSLVGLGIAFVGRLQGQQPVHLLKAYTVASEGVTAKPPVAK